MGYLGQEEPGAEYLSPMDFQLILDQTNQLIAGYISPSPGTCYTLSAIQRLLHCFTSEVPVDPGFIWHRQSRHVGQV